MKRHNRLTLLLHSTIRCQLRFAFVFSRAEWRLLKQRRQRRVEYRLPTSLNYMQGPTIPRYIPHRAGGRRKCIFFPDYPINPKNYGEKIVDSTRPSYVASSCTQCAFYSLKPFTSGVLSNHPRIPGHLGSEGQPASSGAN